MNNRLSKFLEDLHADGVAHDRAQPDRLLKRRNLEPDTAALLGYGRADCPAPGRSWKSAPRTAVQQSGSPIRWVILAELSSASIQRPSTKRATTSRPPTQSNLVSRRALNSARKVAARIWRGLPMRASICSSSTPNELRTRIGGRILLEFCVAAGCSRSTTCCRMPTKSQAS